MAKAKAQVPFEDFLMMVDPQYQPFVTSLSDYMVENGCSIKIEPSKSGYVVSYYHERLKRTMLNFVFRKKGLVARIYAGNIMQYMELLDTLPGSLKKSITKAPVCKRKIDPTACNSRCPMGYEFILDGEPQQKCRYNCFMFFLSDEANPAIQSIIEHEMAVVAKE